jgi:hypothetical protein
VRHLPPWGIWLMIGQSVFLVGLVFVLNWTRHGFRRSAPLAGAMALTCALVIGLVARIGFPSPDLTAIRLVGQVVMTLIALYFGARMIRVRESWRTFRLPGIWVPLVVTVLGVGVFVAGLTLSRSILNIGTILGFVMALGAPVFAGIRTLQLKEQYKRLDDRWGEVVSGEVSLANIAPTSASPAELAEYRQLLQLLLPPGEEKVRLEGAIDRVKGDLAQRQLISSRTPIRREIE